MQKKIEEFNFDINLQTIITKLINGHIDDDTHDF